MCFWSVSTTSFPGGEEKIAWKIATKKEEYICWAVLHTGLICAWFQTNTGSYRVLTQGLHSPNHELFIRRKSYKCLTVSATAYQILYLEEQVEFHSPCLNDSLNNTKLLSFSVARRWWGRVLHLISAQWRLTKSLCACMDLCRRPGTVQQWLWSQLNHHFHLPRGEEIKWRSATMM